MYEDLELFLLLSDKNINKYFNNKKETRKRMK